MQVRIVLDRVVWGLENGGREFVNVEIIKVMFDKINGLISR